jgi:hypothetical protein
MNLLSERACHLLNLKGQQIPFKMEGAGGQITTYNNCCTTGVELGSVSGDFKKNIKVRVIPNPVGKLTPYDWNIYKENWPYLQSLQFDKIESSTVDVLLGAPEAFAMSSLQEVRGGPKDPVARRCPLGWTVLGYLTPQGRDAASTKGVHVNMTVSSVFEVREHVKKELSLNSELMAVKGQQDYEDRNEACSGLVDPIQREKDGGQLGDEVGGEKTRSPSSTTWTSGVLLLVSLLIGAAVAFVPKVLEVSWLGFWKKFGTKRVLALNRKNGRGVKRNRDRPSMGLSLGGRIDEGFPNQDKKVCGRHTRELMKILPESPSGELPVDLDFQGPDRV